MTNEDIVPISLSRPVRHFHYAMNEFYSRLFPHSPQSSVNKWLQEKFRYHAARLRGTGTKLYQLRANMHGVYKEPSRRAYECTWGDMPPARSSQQLEEYLRHDYRESKGRELEDIFDDINFDTQVSASFATVVRGRLKDNGMPVAVKIWYEGIKEAVRRDMAELHFVTKILAKKIPIIGQSILPGYTPRVLQEIQARCEEECEPRREAVNMWNSFTTYKELLSAVDKLPVGSRVQQVLSQRIDTPSGQTDEAFYSTDESLHLMRYGLVHPLPYIDETGREDLCTNNVLVMDWVPGTPTSTLSLERPDGILRYFWDQQMRALAEKNEVFGLLSLHPHTVVDEDNLEYFLNSDIHPANLIAHYSFKYGTCTGIVDFGNVQTLHLEDSKNFMHILGLAIDDGFSNEHDGIPQNREQLAQTYVDAGIVTTTTDQSLDNYLFPFLERTSRPYREDKEFDYSDVAYFKQLNTMFQYILYAPTINVTEKSTWVHRLMYLHYASKHRLGQKVNSYRYMKELRELGKTA